MCGLLLLLLSCGHAGDGARRDKDGYIWITGRVDDVINVSGHRWGLST
jgi:acyl-coenzyme A synthetase/AMP-(fatty) acid ligase